MAVHAAPPSSAVAFQDQAAAITYARLHDQALALAAGLRRLGLGKGDVLAAQLPNGLEFILCYLAAGYVGAVLQPLHLPYRAGEIEPLLRHAKAKALVCRSQAKDFNPAE